MGFLDKAKAAAEQAKTKAKEGIDDVQTKRTLSQHYERLGRTAYELWHNGELDHPRLKDEAEAIHELDQHGEHETSHDAEPAATVAADGPSLAGEAPAAE